MITISERTIEELRSIRGVRDWSVINALSWDARSTIMWYLDRYNWDNDISLRGGYLERLNDIATVVDESIGCDEVYRDRMMRLAANGADVAGNHAVFQRMILDTMHRDDHAMLLPGPDGFVKRNIGSSEEQWMQDVSRQWLIDGFTDWRTLRHGRDPSRTYDDVRTSSVYGMFANLFDDPVGEMIAIGGFREAADIIFAATKLSMKRMSTTYAGFVRTAVAARRDGVEELDWFLRLAIELTTDRGLTLGFEPDIDYVRTNFGLPEDFLLESAGMRGVSDEDYEKAFHAMSDGGWTGLEDDFGMKGDRRRDHQSWSYGTRRAAVAVMRGLAATPPRFAEVPRMIWPSFVEKYADTHPGFGYPIRIVGTPDPRMSGHHGLMTSLSAVMDDPQRLYRWLVSLLEQRMCVDVFTTRTHSGLSSPSELLVGGHADSGGGRAAHANRGIPAEAAEYVEHGIWPETFTYGRDSLIIPDAIRWAFAELTPDRWEGLLNLEPKPLYHRMLEMDSVRSLTSLHHPNG